MAVRDADAAVKVPNTFPISLGVWPSLAERRPSSGVAGYVRENPYSVSDPFIAGAASTNYRAFKAPTVAIAHEDDCPLR